MIRVSAGGQPEKPDGITLLKQVELYSGRTSPFAPPSILHVLDMLSFVVTSFAGSIFRSLNTLHRMNDTYRAARGWISRK